jgi:hypothetical protein
VLRDEADDYDNEKKNAKNVSPKVAGRLLVFCSGHA